MKRLAIILVAFAALAQTARPEVGPYRPAADPVGPDLRAGRTIEPDLRAGRDPVLIALTFDDGFAHHLSVVAPMLEAYGFTGAFSVIVDAVGEPHRLSWDGIRALRDRGHEVFSHSLTHPNLPRLLAAGDTNEVRRQVFESAAVIERELGAPPAVFCLPFNAADAATCAIVREAGMVPMQCSRANFGEGTDPGGEADLGAHLARLRASGARADALMIHGVGAEDGAWRPFRDAAHFESFLRDLSALQASGAVRVVPYAAVASLLAPDR